MKLMAAGVPHSVSGHRTRCGIVRPVGHISSSYDSIVRKSAGVAGEPSSSTSALPGGPCDAVIAAWRPHWVTTIGLWCIALIPFVVDAVAWSAAGWWWVLNIFLGIAWAGMVITLSRPFIEIRPSGCTYRTFGRVVHVQWSEIECLLTAPRLEQPRVNVLLRSPEALVTIETLAGGWSVAARRRRAGSIVEAAAPFVSTVIAPATPVADRATPVVLSRRIGARRATVLWVLLGLAILAFLVYAGSSGPSSQLTPFLTVGFGLVGAKFQRFNQRTVSTWSATSVRFDQTGVMFEFRRGPRRPAIRYASGDVARITVRAGRFSSRLVIVLSNHSLVELRPELVSPRGGASLRSLARHLEAVTARSGR
jgi:hypothetical protein